MLVHQRPSRECCDYNGSGEPHGTDNSHSKFDDDIVTMISPIWYWRNDDIDDTQGGEHEESCNPSKDGREDIFWLWRLSIVVRFHM